jgi:hypothetical protein
MSAPVSDISLQQGTLGLIGLQRLSVLLPERFDSSDELSAPSAVPDGLKPLALSPDQRILAAQHRAAPLQFARYGVSDKRKTRAVSACAPWVRA